MIRFLHTFDIDNLMDNQNYPLLNCQIGLTLTDLIIRYQ